MRAVTYGAMSLAFVSTAISAQVPGFGRQVEQEVTAAVHAFFEGFNTATCENGTSVSGLVTNPTIFVEETEIHRTTVAEFEQGVRGLACSWTKHDGGVDTVVVEAHAPNVATAAWTFHDIVTRKDGSISSDRGAVLQTWVKVDGHWRVAATKSSEVPANAQVTRPSD